MPISDNSDVSDVEMDKQIKTSNKRGRPKKGSLKRKSDINKNVTYRKKSELGIPKRGSQANGKERSGTKGLNRSKTHTDDSEDNSENDNKNNEEHLADLTPNEDGDSTGEKQTKRGQPKKGRREPKTPPQKMMKQDLKSSQSIGKPKSHSKASTNSDDSDDADETYYEVDKIKDVHFRKNGTREFLVSWKGYKSIDDTWEPEAHLNCADLIEKFMERVQKAKDISPKELRRMGRKKQIVPVPHARIHCGYKLRNPGFRPFYEDY